MTFANSTFRRLFFLALSALAVCSPPAFAQDQVINVYFKPVEDTGRLEDLRAQIDRYDAEIVRLVIERARVLKGRWPVSSRPLWKMAAIFGLSREWRSPI